MTVILCIKQHSTGLQVTRNMEELQTQFQTQKHYNNTRGLIEKKLIYQIKGNLITNNAIIVKTDKGNTLVIDLQKSYHEKIQTFVDSNNFTKINKVPTKKYQTDIRNSVNKCPQVINKGKDCFIYNIIVIINTTACHLSRKKEITMLTATLLNFADTPIK